MYSALIVANYIIEYEHSKDRIISNLKLQKLLYFVQAQFLRVLGVPCFNDKMEAWSFEPVVLNVYHAYKFYGGLDIAEPEESEHKNIINAVLELLAYTPVYEMVDITHHQSPWMSANSNPFDNEITNESIKQYFCNL